MEKQKCDQQKQDGISHPIKVTGARVTLDGLAELAGELFWYVSSTRYIGTITRQVVSPSHHLRNLANNT